MQTGVLRVLRATAASWWRHKELRRTGQTGQAQRLERETVLRDLGYLKKAASLPNAHVICGEAVKATGEFATFEPENDPEGWHDFGAVEIRGETVFWKIDLYEADSDFRYGAETPDNPATTVRVLTIMLARDW